VAKKQQAETGQKVWFLELSCAISKSTGQNDYRSLRQIPAIDAVAFR